MIIPFTGFVGTFGVPVPAAATKLDEIGWYLSAAVAGVVYVVLCKLRPLDNMDPDMPWEQLAHEFAASREDTSSVGEVDEKVMDVDGEKTDGYVVSYSPATDV